MKKKKSEFCQCWDGERGSPPLPAAILYSDADNQMGQVSKGSREKNMHLLSAKVSVFCKV